MFKYYHVFLIDKHGNRVKYIDTVKCLNETTAEEQTYNRYGSATKSTVWGRDNFKAVEA